MTVTAKSVAGEGVLGRYGGSFVLAPPDSTLVDAVLDLAREAARDHADAPGRFLPRKVAGLVSQSDDAPTLGIVSMVEDGVAVLLVGDVTMTLVDDSGTSVLSGRDATTWVDKIVRGPWTSMSLVLSGAGEVDRRSDLQGGVVTAGGVQLSPAGMTVPAAPPPPPVMAPPPPPPVQAEPPTMTDLEVPPVTPAEAPAFQSFSLDDPIEAEPLPVARSTMAPAAVAEAPAESVEPVADGAVIVQGIECSRQHFNDPTSIYCAVCGISMVHQTHNLVSGPRPPLGVIVLDDGAVYSLAGDFVLGREPDNAEEVQAGTATPLTLDDPDVTMSRVHAKLQLVGWDVRLVDAGSANGTYTAKPGETEWVKLSNGETVVLKPGTKVSLGGRTFVFDSHHKL